MSNKPSKAERELERLRKANLARVHKYRAKLKAKKLSETSTGGK